MRRKRTDLTSDPRKFHSMESSRFAQIVGLVWLFTAYQICSVQSVQPNFAVKPTNPITGYQEESVNFTWRYSNHSLEKIDFGIWDTEMDTLIYIMLTVERHANGTITTYPTTEENTKQYQGRVRWVGDIASRLISFQLSNLQLSDKKTYGIEVTFRDDLDDLSDSTKLLVKPKSVFTSGPGHFSRKRGEIATFAWKYSLNDDDRRTLTSITFGVYKNNRYEILCLTKVESGAANANCSTGNRNAHLSVLKQTEEMTFVLNQLRLEDEAVYSLRLGGLRRPLENKATLIVDDPPKITQQPESVTITEGKMFELTCAADGKPRPMITWLKDKIQVQRNFSESYVVNVTDRTDAGIYECVAHNKIGSVSSSVEAVVDVQYAPRINWSRKVIPVHVPVGKTADLRCPTIANPTAKFEWTSDGKPKRGNTEHLYVPISTVYDYKNYTCRASNLIGEDVVTFVLTHVGPPSTPRVNCEKREDHSQSRIFYWLVPLDDGGAPLLAYTVKHRTLQGHKIRGAWTNVNITRKKTWYKFQLEWETTFELTVSAWNIYGESELDLVDNSCIITIGKNPDLIPRTAIPRPTREIVAAKAKNVDPNSDKSKVNVLFYVLPCVGLVVIAVVAVLIIKRRSKKRAKGKWDDGRTSGFESGVVTVEGNLWEAAAGDRLLGSGIEPRSRKQSMVGSPRYQMDPEWTIPREKICILKVIGNGAFGLVYKGRVHGSGPNTVGWNIVAIKSPYADATDSETRDLMKEFELLKTLKSHPHVIKLLGCGEDEGRPLVIIEYVPYGDLLGYLRKSRGEQDEYYSDPEIKPNTNVSSKQLIRFGWHVADGMAYLASEKIIHRDLAARNVLVGEGLSCKVTDFGMAKDVSNDDIYVRSTEGRLPVKWTAIEALTGSGEYTTQSDVWSFGVVLYEICTVGADPYPGINGKEIPELLDSGYRMPRPSHVDPELYDVMTSCWKTNPDERPTFLELKETLIKLEEVQSREYINLSECLYQNVGQGGAAKGTKRKSLLELVKAGASNKGIVKGNVYQEGPGLQGHAITAV